MVGLIKDKFSALEDKYSALAESIGMRYDRVNRVMCGQRDGFDLILYAPKRGYGISRLFNSLLWSAPDVHTAAARPAGGMLTTYEKQELANNVKYSGFFQQDGYDIIIPELAGAFWLLDVEGYQKDLAGKLDVLCSFLRDKGYKPCCSRCGQDARVSSFRLGSNYQHLCMACEADTRSRLASQKQKRRRKENVVFGVVGVLLGALPGMAAYAWALQSGLFQMILAGAAMALCILKGYELLGGRLTKKAVAIGSVVMLPIIYLVHRLMWAAWLYSKRDVLMFRLNFWQCFMKIPMMISRGVIDWRAYIGVLVKFCLALLMGAVPTIVYLFKRNKRKEQWEWFAMLG